MTVRFTKRLLSMLCAFIMVFNCLMPTSLAFADEPEEPQQVEQTQEGTEQTLPDQNTPADPVGNPNNTEQNPSGDSTGPAESNDVPVPENPLAQNSDNTSGDEKDKSGENGSDNLNNQDNLNSSDENPDATVSDGTGQIFPLPGTEELGYHDAGTC